MIPKTLHYCWFGPNEIPESIKDNINDWGKKLPDYNIKLWNEDNFDINMNSYVNEAYEAGKYAFVTDYVRLYALYNHGGIYLDTDVEIVKSLEPFLNHQAFTGCENNENSVTGTIGSVKGHEWIKTLLNYYTDKNFILPDGSYDLTTNTTIITEITINQFGWKPLDEQQELRNGLIIYPFEYFCAKDYKTGKIHETENTYTIHHFSGSWKSNKSKVVTKITQLIGPENTEKLQRIRRSFKKTFRIR